MSRSGEELEQTCYLDAAGGQVDAVRFFPGQRLCQRLRVEWLELACGVELWDGDRIVGWLGKGLPTWILPTSENKCQESA